MSNFALYEKSLSTTGELSVVLFFRFCHFGLMYPTKSGRGWGKRLPLVTQFRRSCVLNFKHRTYQTNSIAVIGFSSNLHRSTKRPTRATKWKQLNLEFQCPWLWINIKLGNLGHSRYSKLNININIDLFSYSKDQFALYNISNFHPQKWLRPTACRS